MSHQITVALLYNDIPYEAAADQPVDLSPDALGFTPYFDLEETPAEQEYANIEHALVEAGYNVISYNVQDRFERLFKFLAKRKIDVIFNLVEFFHGRSEQEMHVASFFELLQIPYTGAPPLALAICQNKALAKDILRAHNLPTPKSITIRTLEELKPRHGLTYPVIVKPACEDGSGGIEESSIVGTFKELKARVEYVLSYFGMDALVEEFIDGRELNVSVIGNGSRRRALPISEIDFDEMPEHLHKIVSYQAKWEPLHEAYHKTIPSCPADLPARITKEAQRIAMEATRALGTRDYARVDMRLDKKGKLYILEVNPNPNLAEGTGIARSAQAARMKFSTLLSSIVESAIDRKPLQAAKAA